MDPGKHSSKSRLAKSLRITGGVLLIAAGTLMLVLPGPGWLTIFAGIVLLGPNTRPARWLRRKLARIRRWARDFRKDARLRRQARRSREQDKSPSHV
jgi:UPF0716 family protein affecting phage T7 exclusion